VIYGEFFEFFFRFLSKNREFKTPVFIENISHKVAKFCQMFSKTVLTATVGWLKVLSA
jgi:hypothetical protein